MNKMLLQLAVFIGAWIPAVAGLIGIINGSAMTGTEDLNIDVDSHIRYLSGLLFAIGLGFWSTIPNIEHKEARFRLLTLIVLIGGIARLISVIIHGFPSTIMVFGLGMELLVTPALCIWQSRLAKSYRTKPRP